MGSPEQCGSYTSFKLKTVSVGGQTETGRKDKPPREVKAATTECSQQQGQTVRLPDGLIGTKCTTQITIGKRKVNCLLDTGSQVTTIPHSLYESQLSDHPLKPLNNLLEVEGVNGQAVPYHGYVEVNITFPEDFLGSEIEVPTLSLVVPDMCNVSQILIGTNTLDVLYSMSLQEGGVHKPSSHGYRAVLKILEARRKQSDTGALGWVKVQGPNCEVIPAGHTVVVDARVCE